MTSRRHLMPTGLAKTEIEKYQQIGAKNFSNHLSTHTLKGGESTDFVTIQHVIDAYKAQIVDGKTLKQSEKMRKKRALKLLDELFKRFDKEDQKYTEIF